MKFPSARGERDSEAEIAEEDRHKERSVWFRERAAYPFREADPDPLIKYRTERNGRPAGPHQWEPLGPDNCSGRFTSLAIHPSKPDRIFAGAAGGGVWRSDNGGDNWKPLWSQQETLNAGSLAVDPRDPDWIFCGTGEANLSSDSYSGAGLYLSQDAGESWRLLIGASGTELFPRRIGSLALRTNFSNRQRDTADTVAFVYLGSVTHADEDFSRLVGVRLRQQGEANGEFDTSFISGQNYWAHCVLMHPAGHLFVAVQGRGSLSGIWRGSEFADGFEHLQKGLPEADRFGRVSLAYAPSKPSVLYALAENRGRVLGVFRSDNLGDSWRRISGEHFRRESQASYNNCIAVDPEDHNTVYCGLVNMHRSRNGGRTWERISNWRLGPSNKHFVHGDCHAISIPMHGRVFVACDGGIFRSDDGGDSWRDLNHGLQTTMFYDIDVAPSDGNIYSGGAQDNGVLVHTGDNESRNFEEALTGDGGWTMFDPDDAFHLWGSTQHMNLRVTKKNAWVKVTPQKAEKSERTGVWLSFLAMDTSRARRRPRTVFAGSTRVWRTRTDGRTWRAVSPHLDKTLISAIEVATADPRFVYVGTTKGGFFRSTDGGDSWSEDLAGPELPGRIITRIEAHPRDPKLVVLTVGQTPRNRRVIVQLPAASGALTAATSRFAHVFISRDGGLSWAAGDLGDDGQRQLPDVPFNSLAFETQPPFRLFLASDAGIFEGHVDGGAPKLASASLGGAVQKYFAEKAEAITWMDISGTLPNAPVTDIVYHDGTGALFVSTFGRGIWRLKI